MFFKFANHSNYLNDLETSIENCTSKLSTTQKNPFNLKILFFICIPKEIELNYIVEFRYKIYFKTIFVIETIISIDKLTPKVSIIVLCPKLYS
jgi:hypothetical protein